MFTVPSKKKKTKLVHIFLYLFKIQKEQNGKKIFCTIFTFGVRLHHRGERRGKRSERGGETEEGVWRETGEGVERGGRNRGTEEGNGRERG